MVARTRLNVTFIRTLPVWYQARLRIERGNFQTHALTFGKSCSTCFDVDSVIGSRVTLDVLCMHKPRFRQILFKFKILKKKKASSMCKHDHCLCEMRIFIFNVTLGRAARTCLVFGTVPIF